MEAIFVVSTGLPLGVIAVDSGSGVTVTVTVNALNGVTVSSTARPLSGPGSDFVAVMIGVGT